MGGPRGPRAPIGGRGEAGIRLDPQEGQENLDTLKAWKDEATAVIEGRSSELSFTKDSINAKVAAAKKHEALMTSMMKGLKSRK